MPPDTPVATSDDERDDMKILSLVRNNRKGANASPALVPDAQRIFIPGAAEFFQNCKIPARIVSRIDGSPEPFRGILDKTKRC